MREILSVLFVFALLGGALWALRRRGLRSMGFSPWSGFRRLKPAPRTLETVERVALTPQHTLHVVRMDGRSLLIATFPGGCTLLEMKSECAS